MSDESSNWKISKFSGKDDDWLYWSPQVLARAEARGYRSVLDGSEAAPADSEVLNPTLNKDKIKLRNANKAGYAELLALCTGAKVPFLMVKQARTVELPNGCLKTAWKALMDRYESKEQADVHDVIEEYNNCKLEKGQDPEEWIATKNEIRLRLQLEYAKQDYDDANFINSVIYNLPEEYYAHKLHLKEKQNVTLKQVVDALRERP